MRKKTSRINKQFYVKLYIVRELTDETMMGICEKIYN